MTRDPTIRPPARRPSGGDPDHMPPPAPPADRPRTDATRDRLLDAALDVFGRLGYDGATTRRIAEAAGANLQAITYHFGGKEGLYVATADHLGDAIDRFAAPLRAPLRARFAELDAAGETMTAGEAAAHLRTATRAMVHLFAGDVSAAWARFMIREQQEPTAAFDRLYARLMEPLLGILRRLVAAVLGLDPDGAPARLRTLSLLGSILVFRVARATALRQLGWPDFGADELSAVERLADDLVDGLCAQGGQQP